MDRQKYIPIMSAFFMLFLLIIDSQTAVSGAKEGLDICMRSVIPSLFPFITLSTILTHAFTTFRFRSLRILFHVSEGSEGILVSGLLGGYPVGAQCVANALSRKQISEKSAAYLLSFCNQAGPSFIFGILASQFPSPYYPWLLWIILIISAVLVARSQPYAPDHPYMHPGESTLTFPEAVKKSVCTMAYICGWIILFRVIISLADKWFFRLLPVWIKPTIFGLLELSNGLLALSEISDIHLRFLSASLLLSCGGVCVAMQTASVSQGVSMHTYRRGKLLQTFYSFLLSSSAICLMKKPFKGFITVSVLLWIFIFILPHLIRKTQKRVA